VYSAKISQTSAHVNCNDDEKIEKRPYKKNSQKKGYPQFSERKDIDFMDAKNGPTTMHEAQLGDLPT
jgi:hypothetical protein